MGISEKIVADYNLTQRQAEILDLISRGYTNKDIAAFLKIAINTVKIHVAGVLNKLGAVNRTEATYICMEYARQEADNWPCLFVKKGRENSSGKSDVRADLFRKYLEKDLLTGRWFSVLSSDHRELPARVYEISVDIISGASEGVIECSVLEMPGDKVVYQTMMNFSSKESTLETSSHSLCSLIIAELKGRETQRVLQEELPLLSPRELLLIGYHLLSRRTEETLLQASELFLPLTEDYETAVLALMGLSLCHYRFIVQQHTRQLSENMLLLKKFATDCYNRDTGCVYGYYSLGLYNIVASKPELALTYLQQAVELCPSFTCSYIVLVQVYIILDRPEEALLCVERVKAINPSLPDFDLNRGALSLLYFAAERYQEAVFACETCLQVKNNLPVLLILIASCSLLEQSEESYNYKEKLVSLYPDFSINSLKPLLQPFHQRHQKRFFLGLEKAGIYSSESCYI